MNLVQKLPIGLSLACLMFMSSCSKEDALTPEPKMESVNGHSNAKETGPIVVTAGMFSSTKGQTGSNVYPLNWKRGSGNFSTDQVKYPSGTSTFSHLWGDSSLPWVKPLPAIPSFPESTMITIIANTSDYQVMNKGSHVDTKIKYLIPGKKYAITFRVATTVRESPISTVYAKTIRVWLNTFPGQYKVANIDMTGKVAQWVEQTITFTASSPEHHLLVQALSPEEGKYSYAHIVVEESGIKKVN